MSSKMAMKIGGGYRPKYVRARHLDRMLGEAGLGVAAARRRLRGLASAAPDASHVARADLAEGGWDAPVLGRVVATVEQRAQWLQEITAPKARAVGS